VFAKSTLARIGRLALFAGVALTGACALVADLEHVEYRPLPSKDGSAEASIPDVAGGPCSPDCAGKQCGPDNCGGQCGACDDYEICGLAWTCQSTAYDFIANAPTAPGGWWGDLGRVTWNDKAVDRIQFGECFTATGPMEDGNAYLYLATLPSGMPWPGHTVGWIKGIYNVTIPPSSAHPMLYTTFGLVQNHATNDGVHFSVATSTNGGQSYVNNLNAFKVYTGALVTQTVDMAAYASQAVVMSVGSVAGADSINDWAAWTDARILKDTVKTTMGETALLDSEESRNANLLLAQEATLTQAATLRNLAFYVVSAAGNLRMGVYDATGPSGGPGHKLAETAEITPQVWLEQGVRDGSRATRGRNVLARVRAEQWRSPPQGRKRGQPRVRLADVWPVARDVLDDTEYRIEPLVVLRRTLTLRRFADATFAVGGLRSARVVR
jgi:hypothetical protein